MSHIKPAAPLFDHAALTLHRCRAAPLFDRHAFLFEEGAERLGERLDSITRHFDTALVLGPRQDNLARTLAPRVASLASFDTADQMIPESFDLIASVGGLHWTEDWPDTLMRIRLALRTGGAFMAILPGGESLHELRTCLMDAELAVTDGASPRTAPMLDAMTASALLHQAGFALPVADREHTTLVYHDMFALMRDLRGMGETNALTGRLRHPTRRRIFDEAARLYADRFPAPSGGVRATVEAITLHGWNDG